MLKKSRCFRENLHRFTANSSGRLRSASSNRRHSWGSPSGVALTRLATIPLVGVRVSAKGMIRLVIAIRARRAISSRTIYFKLI